MKGGHPSPLGLLPHSYPFLLIDRIIEAEAGERIVCLKNVTFNEAFFEGHFRENPVMPGVLLIEAMAQASGLLLSSGSEAGPKLAFLAQVKNARFRAPVLPGDSLVITAVRQGGFGELHMFGVSVSVEGKTVADGDIVLAEMPVGPNAG